MRVLMLLANPFVSDPRVYREATSLLRAGHEVVVVAWDREGREPPRQCWDGIEIVRLRTKPKVRYGPGSWLWNAGSLLLWQRSAYRRAMELHMERRFDVIHCHDLNTLAVGTRLKRRLGLPLIYDAHEMYAYMMARRVPRGVTAMLFRLEKRLVNRADRVINVSAPQKRYFETITSKPIDIVMNCKPLRYAEYQATDNEEVTFLYLGGLGTERSLPVVIEAARDLPGVRCLIGGSGRPAAVQEIKDACSRTSNVEFLGILPFDEVLPATKRADCVVLMLDPRDYKSRFTMANKQFEAMVCGRPIVCTEETYPGELTEQEGVGLTVEHDSRALREAMMRLRDDPALREKLGRNALRAAMTKYNWEREEQKLLQLYSDLRPDEQYTGE